MKNKTDNHIIFLSYGDPFYLPYVLSQCKAYHPYDHVHLIGDSSNKGYAGIEHHLISDYENSAKEFAKHYVHLSTNNEKFERFCFDRFFIIKEFIIKNNIKECIIIDTDVLVYGNLFDDFPFFDNYDCTLYLYEKNLVASPGLSFVKNTKCIDDLCRFMLELYKERNSIFDLLSNHFNHRQSKGLQGGACDMNVFYYFYKNNTVKVFDLFEVLPNNHYYDISFIDLETVKYTFEGTPETGKKVIFKNKIPYGIIHGRKEMIKYQVLHFQGWQKELIPRFTTRKGRFFLYNMIWIPVKNFIAAMLRGQWSLYFNFK